MTSSLISFSGLASGIDSAGLIKALMDREREARVTPLQNKITSIGETNDSFGKLKELLNKLQAATAKFRLVNGGAVSRNAASSDETVATVSASNAAVNGSYSISVDSLAKNGTYTFGSADTTYTTSSQAINSNISGGDKNVTVEVGTGSNKETVSIDLTSSTTLSDFVSQFNNQSSNATASVVNVGTSFDPSYKIMVTSNNSGVDKGTIAVTIGAGITDPDGNPLTNDGAFDSTTLDQAGDATFTIPGVGTDITRAGNTVSDLFPGLTISLKGQGSASLTVTDNSENTTQAVQEFVDAWNEVVNYVKEKDTVTRDESGSEVRNIFGPFASTSLDENILSALRSALSGTSTSGGLVNTLSELGISTQRDGTLAFDTKVFGESLGKDSESVKTLLQNLGETLAATDGTIAQFTRFNGLIDINVNSNNTQISGLESRVNDAERALSSQEDSLSQRFARLERLMAQMTSQQSSLASMLPK